MRGRWGIPLRRRFLTDCRKTLPACVAATAIACATFEVRAQQPATVIDLQRYIELAVQLSDQVRDIDDDLVARQLDIDMAELAFETRVTPLANFNVGAAAETRRVGVEAQRKNEFGTAVGVGLESRQIASNTFAVINPYNTRAYIRVSQGLLRNWGRRYNRIGLTVAELQRERELLSAQRRRQDLLLDAVQRYHAALLAELLVERSAQALQRADSHIVAARARQRAGLTSKVDVYRAELASLTAQNAYRDQQRAAARERERMHDLLALDEAGRYRPQLQIERWTPLIPEDWQNDVLNSRPEWQMQAVDKQIADLQTYRAQRDLSADLSLSVQLEQQGYGETYEESTTLDETDWSLLLQYSTTLERGEEHNNLQRQRRSRSRVARAGRALKRQIQREAREILADLAASERRYQISLQQLAQAEQALQLADIRFRRGLSSNADVVDSEIAFSNAELDVVSTRIAYNNVAARLGYVFGLLDERWLRATMVAPEDQ
ncbi:MAG: TolC family protein [Gammaproteobacteria bacterium]|nr:TolC family protein [Gammaproteobacteria bacterium]